MTEPRYTEDELRRALQRGTKPAVRWDRVAVLRRRRTFLALAGLILTGLALTIVLSLGLLAGKSALDPSFQPPLLSNVSGDVEMADPKLGWGLLESGPTSSKGYLMRVDLDVSGLKNSDLVAKWAVFSLGKAHGVESPLRQIERIPIHSKSDHQSLEKWIPRPRHSGIYRVHVAVWSEGGKLVDQDKSAPIYVFASDCCRTYETPMYAAPLPKGWALREDFAPNPEERFVTLAMGPGGSSLDIDTSLIDPENQGSDPLESAHELEGLLAKNAPGYKRLSWRVYRMDGNLTVEWSYMTEGDAFTDIFFYRGPSSFAVRGRGNPRHFRELRDLTRFVAQSIDPRN